MAMATTLGNQPSRHFTLLALAGLGVVAAITAGCGSDGASPLVQVPNDAEKPANSVYREVSPGTRSSQLTTQLNLLRQQAFGPTIGAVTHDDVLYTAAFRHAVYLNTINSAGSNVASPFSGIGDSKVLTGDSSYLGLMLESLAPTTTAQWPALYTHNELYPRVEAVVGGRTLLASAAANVSSVGEAYIFNGDIYRTDGTISDFRSYSADSSTAIDNVWYSRYGRSLTMRAALRSFGYGQKDDTSAQKGQFNPPYPILGGKFLGVVTTMAATPELALLGYWPNDSNQDVRPYGLDTDMSGPNQVGGPPLHVTLPVDEPLLRDSGVTTLALTKVSGNGGVGLATNVPLNGDQYRVYSNVSGLVVPSIVATGAYLAIGPIAPFLNNIRVTAITGLFISNSIQPATSPLTFTVQGVNISNFTVGDRVTIKVEKRVDPNDPNVVTGSLVSCQITAVDSLSNSIIVSIPTTAFSNILWGPRLQESLKVVNALTYVDAQNVTLDLFKTGVTAVSADVDNDIALRNGEIIVVPVAPLEPLTWYRFDFNLRTASYSTGLKTSYFRTNNKGL